MIVISYQDIKDRLIYWFLPVLVALALAFVHYETVGIFNFMWNSIFNVLLVSSILIILKVYMRFRFREGNFSNYFGFGDVLFIYAIALGFATVAFITLFVFGLFFSLLLHWIFASNILNVSKKSEKHQTSVPLAGYLSLFYIGILLTHWLGGYDQLYVI